MLEPVEIIGDNLGSARDFELLFDMQYARGDNLSSAALTYRE